MSAVQPQQNLDPTRGMNLVSNVNPDREKTRYLFFAGQILDPDRVAQVEHLRDAGGGEEVQTHCFRRTVGGFLPRGHLTPMETWVEALPSELIGEGAESSTVHIVQGAMTSESLGMSRRPGLLLGKPLSNVKFYPGDEVLSVLRANQGKGIVEVKALFNVPWYKDEAETQPGIPQTLNRLFFPGTPPPTLRELRARIRQVADETAVSDLVASVARDMLTSCDQFERWAQAFLAVEHTLLRQRVSVTGQYTYTYSPVARELLRQLEMQPQDNIVEGLGGISGEQFAAIMARFAPQDGGGVSPALVAQIAGQVAREIIAAQTGQSPATPEQAIHINGANVNEISGNTFTNSPEVKDETPQPEQAPADSAPVPRRKKTE